MKKNILAILIIALGVLMMVGTSLIWHAETPEAFTEIVNEETGAVEIVGPDWRDNEPTMPLEKVKSIVGFASVVTVIGLLMVLIGKRKNLKRHDVFAVVFITLSVLVVVGFLTIFYPCAGVSRTLGPNDVISRRPMRCFYTMRTLIAVVGAIGFSGVLMLMFNRSKDIARGLSFAVVTMAVAFLLIPSMATGWCSTVMMTCVPGTRPFALVMGCILLVTSVVGALMLRGRGEDEDGE